MTREEAIIEAGIEYSIQNSPYCIGGDNFYEKARELNRNESFEAGAIWADKNPKSPWISVKDDLPCNHEEKIHKDCLSTTNVFALYSDYSLGLNYMRKINNKWIWHNGEPLYWMDMPNYLPTIENEV